jgi:hypothetical protein
MTGLIVLAALSNCLQQQTISYSSRVQSYQQAYVAPQVMYFVGAPLRVQSLVEHQQRTDPDYQEFLEFKAWKAGSQQQNQLRQEQLPPPPEAPSGLTVREACSKCHGKATPEGEFFLDGQYGIDAKDVTRAIRMIASGEMPKNRKLTREEKNQVLQDLLSLEFQEEQTPDIPTPTEEIEP